MFSVFDGIFVSLNDRELFDALEDAIELLMVHSHSSQVFPFVGPEQEASIWLRKDRRELWTVRSDVGFIVFAEISRLET